MFPFSFPVVFIENQIRGWASLWQVILAGIRDMSHLGVREPSTWGYSFSAQEVICLPLLVGLATLTAWELPVSTLPGLELQVGA